MKEAINGFFVLSFLGFIGATINFIVKLGLMLVSQHLPTPSTILWSGLTVAVTLVILLMARFFSDKMDQKEML